MGLSKNTRKTLITYILLVPSITCTYLVLHLGSDLHTVSQQVVKLRPPANPHISQEAIDLSTSYILSLDRIPYVPFQTLFRFPLISAIVLGIVASAILSGIIGLFIPKRPIPAAPLPEEATAADTQPPSAQQAADGETGSDETEPDPWRHVKTPSTRQRPKRLPHGNDEGPTTNSAAGPSDGDGSL